MRDSRQTAELAASLEVQLRENRVRAGTPFAARVTTQNTGLAVWLPTSAGAGAVHLGCHLLDVAGKVIDPDYCRCLLTPGTGTSILPGDRVTMEAQIPSPQQGRYVIEFDLVAEEVCWFAQWISDGARAG